MDSLGQGIARPAGKFLPVRVGMVLPECCTPAGDLGNGDRVDTREILLKRPTRLRNDAHTATWLNHDTARDADREVHSDIDFIGVDGMLPQILLPGARPRLSERLSKLLSPNSLDVN